VVESVASLMNVRNSVNFPVITAATTGDSEQYLRDTPP
jgi:hypothetical protein